MALDRYILDRNFLNIDQANYWLHRCTLQEQINHYRKTTALHLQDVRQPERVEYINQLRRIFDINENRSSILPLPAKMKKIGNACEFENQWPVRPRSKPMYKSQLAVLDLPNIRNDICSNVTDWTSNNHIVAALGKVIWIWNVDTSKMHHHIECFSEVIALKADAQSKMITFSCKDMSSLKAWSFETHKIRTEFRPLGCRHDKCHITCIDYHISNDYIIITDEVVNLISIISLFGWIQNVGLPAGMNKFPSFIFLEYNDVQFLEGCTNGNIGLLGMDLKRVITVRNAHGNLDVIKVKGSPDGRFIASCGYDGYINVWSFPDFQLIYSYFQAYCSRGLSWHPWKSSLLCVGTSNGHLALLNVSLGQCIYSKREANTIIYEVTFNKVSGELVVSQTYVKPDYPETYVSQINVLANFNHVVDRFEGHTRRVLFLDWSPDNRILASAGSDETIHLWNFFEKSNEPEKKKFNNRPDFDNFFNYIR